MQFSIYTFITNKPLFKCVGSGRIFRFLKEISYSMLTQAEFIQ